MNRDLHSACSCVPLAENEIGGVTLCPQCGVVTMRLQYVSLRFETEAFERVASLVTQAQAQLGRPRSFSPSRRDAVDLAELRDEPTPKPH